MGIKEDKRPGIQVLTFFIHPDVETMFLDGTFGFLAARLIPPRREGGEDLYIEVISEISLPQTAFRE